MKLLREILFPLIAVIAALIVGGIVVLIIGDNPFHTYRLMFGSAFSWPDGIGYTLFNATPLIFTGLAVAVAFRCGLLNIGAEGQLYVAAFATAWIGIKFGGVVISAPDGTVVNTPYANLPMLILLPLCCIAAIVAGAVWGGIPGLLKAKFGSHEVINTIMLNFIAVALVSYFTQYMYKIPGDAIMQTAPISSKAHIARLGKFIPHLPERIPLNLAFVLAVLACIFVYVLLWKTKWGYEIRATGQRSPSRVLERLHRAEHARQSLPPDQARDGIVLLGNVRSRLLRLHRVPHARRIESGPHAPHRRVRDELQRRPRLRRNRRHVVDADRRMIGCIERFDERPLERGQLRRECPFGH